MKNKRNLVFHAVLNKREKIKNWIKMKKRYGFK